VLLEHKGAEGDRNGFYQGLVQALRLCLPFAGRLLFPSGFYNIGPLKKLSSDASFAYQTYSFTPWKTAVAYKKPGLVPSQKGGLVKRLMGRVNKLKGAMV
jgi:hypothetical protein